MPKPYQPAVFQPTIRPSWAGSFEYISSEELSQILKAITVFPNADVPDSAFWNQTVKPDLEQQYQNFINTCEKRGRGARTYWGEHKLSLCNTYDNHKNTISITQGNLCKDKDKDKDKDNKGGVGEIDFDTIFQAGGQLWTLPPNFRKLALTKYTESEIRAFEMTHSCHENPENVCLNDIKHEPKTTRFVKPTVEEIKAYCRERMNFVEPQKFFDYYESNGWKVGKNPMKDWKAAVRTWEKNNYGGQSTPRMSYKDMKELENDIKLQKLLNGE